MKVENSILKVEFMGSYLGVNIEEDSWSSQDPEIRTFMETAIASGESPLGAAGRLARIVDMYANRDFVFRMKSPVLHDASTYAKDINLVITPLYAVAIVGGRYYAKYIHGKTGNSFQGPKCSLEHAINMNLALKEFEKAALREVNHSGIESVREATIRMSRKS